MIPLRVGLTADFYYITLFLKSKAVYFLSISDQSPHFPDEKVFKFLDFSARLYE